MTITVKCFASLRDQTGISEMQLDSANLNCVSDVWTAITDQSIDDDTLCAVNHQYAKLDHAIYDGDEVAFFPPVTGG